MLRLCIACYHAMMMKSLGIRLSLLYFGIPALALAAGFYLLMPALIQRGVLPYYAYSLGLGLPLLTMLVASMVAYRLEGHPFTWSALLARFNYRPLSTRDLLIVAGIFAVEMALYLVMTRLTGWLNWFLFFFSVLLLGINLVGEEFWWRGLILPRQQLAFADRTLLVHALLWTLFHGFKYWDLLNLLPLWLGLTFAVLYLNNSSAGLVMHFISNGVGLLPILLGVLGIG